MVSPNYASEVERRIDELERQITSASSISGSKGQQARSIIPTLRSQQAELRRQLESGQITDPTVVERAQIRAEAKAKGQSRDAPSNSLSAARSNSGIRDSVLGGVRQDDVAQRVAESQRRRAAGDLGVRPASFGVVSSESASARSSGSSRFSQKAELALAQEDVNRRIAARQEISRQVGASASSKFYDKLRQGVAKDEQRRARYGVQASRLSGPAPAQYVLERQALKQQARSEGRDVRTTRSPRRFDTPGTVPTSSGIPTKETISQKVDRALSPQDEFLGNDYSSRFFKRIASGVVSIGKGAVKGVGYSATIQSKAVFSKKEDLEKYQSETFADRDVQAFSAASATAMTLPLGGAGNVLRFGVGGLLTYSTGKTLLKEGPSPENVADFSISALGTLGEVGGITRTIKLKKVKLLGDEVAAEAIIAPEVLAGKQKFPTTTSAIKSLQDFKSSRTPAGTIEVFHSTPKEFNSVTSVKPGAAALAGLEDPGLFVTPGSRGASPHFLGIEQGKGVKFSLLPDVNFRNPSIVKVNLLDVKRQPPKIIRAKDFSAAEEFLSSKAGSGEGFITRRSELRQTAEIEAVIPVGTRLVRRPGPATYTTYKGQTVPVVEYDVALGQVSPSEFAKVQGNILRQSSSSYSYYSRGKVITPYSGLSVSTYYRPSSVVLSSRSSILSSPSQVRASSIGLRSLSRGSSSPISSRTSSPPPSSGFSGGGSSRGNLPFSNGGGSSGGNSGRSSPGISLPGGSSSVPSFSTFSGTRASSRLVTRRVQDSFTRQYRFDTPDIRPRVIEPTKPFKYSQPKAYTPTLYSITGNVQAKKKGAKVKGLSGLEIRPVLKR